jgi:hypothetical protein
MIFRPSINFEDFDVANFDDSETYNATKNKKRRPNARLQQKLGVEQAAILLKSTLPDHGVHIYVNQIARSTKMSRTTLKLSDGQQLQLVNDPKSSHLDKIIFSDGNVTQSHIEVAMAAFKAAGYSVHPDHIKFNGPADFVQKARLEWTQEYVRQNGGGGFMSDADLYRNGFLENDGPGPVDEATRKAWELRSKAAPSFDPNEPQLDQGPKLNRSTPYGTFTPDGKPVLRPSQPSAATEQLIARQEQKASNLYKPPMPR